MQPLSFLANANTTWAINLIKADRLPPQSYPISGNMIPIRNLVSRIWSYHFSPLSRPRVQVAAIDNHLFGKAEWLEPLQDTDTTTTPSETFSAVSKPNLTGERGLRMRVFELPHRLIRSQPQHLLSSRCIALVDMNREVPYRGSSSWNCAGFRGLSFLSHRSQTTRRIDPES